MEIFLPKTETGGGEKDKAHWEAKAHLSSATEKEQIVAFEEYFAKLSKKLKEIDENSKIAEKTLQNAEKNAKKTLEISEKTRDLVIFGFFVLLFMLAGLVFSLFAFLPSKENSERINNEYDSDIAKQQEFINIQQEQIRNLKNSIDFTKNCIQNFGFTYKCFK